MYCVCCGAPLSAEGSMICKNCQNIVDNNLLCPACGSVLALYHSGLEESKMYSIWHCKTCLRDWESYEANVTESNLIQKFWG